MDADDVQVDVANPTSESADVNAASILCLQAFPTKERPPLVASPVPSSINSPERLRAKLSGNEPICPLGQSGWATVEDRMHNYDEETMKNYFKDIDTLLVFAGLLSAVLTAFVVPSFQMLQPDNTALSVQILLHISAQLGSLTLIDPFVNSTVSPMPAATISPISPMARSLNALWFLSLVFSLAAAFLGILAKQWMREYLRWNTALTAPEENVMLRQMRFDAWNSSNVTAIIVSIPALLETAVVLFLIGVVILLWTLDTITAAIITVAVAVFFAAASTVIVLPAFTRHSPYKSPTGWVLAKIWDSLHNLCTLIIRLRQSSIRSFKDWRERELAFDAGTYSLSRQDAHFQHHVRTLDVVENGQSAALPAQAVQLSITLLAKVEALRWVRRAFQDKDVGVLVMQCLDNLSELHDIGRGTRRTSGSVSYLLHDLVRKVAPSLLSPRICGRTSLPFWAALSRQNYSIVDAENGFKVVAMPVLPHSRKDLLATCIQDSWDYLVLFHVSFHLLEELCRRDGSHEDISGILDLLLFVHALSEGCRSDLEAHDYTDLLGRYHKFLLRNLLKNGLRTPLLAGASNGMRSERWMATASHLYTLPAHVLPLEQDERLHMFVMVAHFALSRDTLWPSLDEQTCRLLLHQMTDIAQKRLDTLTKNCGCYTDLPWITTLLKPYFRDEIHNFVRSPRHVLPMGRLLVKKFGLRREVAALVAILGESFRQGLITGEDNRVAFPKLETIVLSELEEQDVDEPLPSPEARIRTLWYACQDEDQKQ
ncbi:hypothetical protein NM688_g4963 [Phlebia brevispora]|uniref:Uncharacterized protein n=1 Tax=Phlebia brevispora TaxID=194682 RepID=A0ACC1T1J4_9APHY|nr:hypothetical protein NM688_g4963 [Phlebia brevispora]